jgi:hypothetical protein
MGSELTVGLVVMGGSGCGKWIFCAVSDGCPIVIVALSKVCAVSGGLLK